MLKADAGVGGGKSPPDDAGFGVSLLFPSRKLAGHFRRIGNGTVEALPE